MTFNELHDRWDPEMIPPDVMAGDAFADHLRSLCVHCLRGKKEHAGRKCLFGPSAYQKITPRVAEFYERWYHGRDGAPKDYDDFWETEIDDVS